MIHKSVSTRINEKPTKILIMYKNNQSSLCNTELSMNEQFYILFLLYFNIRTREIGACSRQDENRRE